jgi:putative cardiolipin synthase
MKLPILKRSFALSLLLLAIAPASFAQIAGTQDEGLPGDGNLVQVINHGVAAFEKRFEMIDRAQQSIDVEYFIYNHDKAGRLFSQALLAKKKQNPNLRIRILLDASATVLELDPYYVSAFAAHGIEIRYYNSIALWHFDKVQYRDHRKLIVIDGKEAITGSRNIADEYFDMASDFNFRDRDIWVEGPIVTEMQQSFEDYWASNIVIPGPKAGVLNSKKKRALAKKANDFFVQTKADASFLSAIRSVGARVLNETKAQSTGECESLTYKTDLPGFQNEGTRRVLPKILERMRQMQSNDTLYVESPYFIIHDKNAKDEMAFLKDMHIKGVLLTNSLASTDAYYVAANFYPNASFYKSIYDSAMYIFKGDRPKGLEAVNYKNGPAINAKARFGIHSKTFVFSDSAFTTGTFNVDPRSANLNSEMMLFCEGNKKLTQFVVDDIKDRIAESDLLGKDGKLANGNSIFKNVDYVKKMEFHLAILPSEWFSYLL